MTQIAEFMDWLNDFEKAVIANHDGLAVERRIALISMFQEQVDLVGDPLLAAYKIALNNNASVEHLQYLLKMLSEKKE